MFCYMYIHITKTSLISKFQGSVYTINVTFRMCCSVRNKFSTGTAKLAEQIFVSMQDFSKGLSNVWLRNS